MSLFRCAICGKWGSLRKYDPRDFNFVPLIKVMKGRGYGRSFETVEEYPLTRENHPEFYQLYMWQIGNVAKYFSVDEGEEDEEFSEEEEEMQFWDEIQESISNALGLKYKSPEDAVQSLIENYNELLEQFDDSGFED